MGIALIVLAALLGVAAAGSGIQKLRRDATVVSAMHAVGVRDPQIPILAILELLGAAGLIVGIWVPFLGMAAAIGLALYFLGAVIAHIRAKSSAKETAPAFIIMLIAIATAILEVMR
ncbi:MAG: DoxX family protein [Actinomycetota bacterium]